MTSNNEPLDHILRSPLPWRDQHLTECGRAADKVGSTIDATQLAERIKTDGKTRTVYTVCMACWRTFGWTERWGNHPVGALYRESAATTGFRPSAAAESSSTANPARSPGPAARLSVCASTANATRFPYIRHGA